MTPNSDLDVNLFDEQFIVFEIDKIKDDPVLFPIVVLIIMDVFLQKMRIKKGRKALIIEEAWKAIASPTMAEYIKYLYKTVRKFHGIAGVVTRELNDVIDSPIVKEAIINNSDVKILLDQTKFKDRYEDIAAILGLTPIQRQQIFTINARTTGKDAAISRKSGYAGDNTRMCTVWRKHRNATGLTLPNVRRRKPSNSIWPTTEPCRKPSRT